MTLQGQGVVVVEKEHCPMVKYLCIRVVNSSWTDAVTSDNCKCSDVRTNVACTDGKLSSHVILPHIQNTRPDIVFNSIF